MMMMIMMMMSRVRQTNSGMPVIVWAAKQVCFTLYMIKINYISLLIPLGRNLQVTQQ